MSWLRILLKERAAGNVVAAFLASAAEGTTVAVTYSMSWLRRFLRGRAAGNAVAAFLASAAEGTTVAVPVPVATPLMYFYFIVLLYISNIIGLAFGCHYGLFSPQAIFRIR